MATGLTTRTSAYASIPWLMNTGNRQLVHYQRSAHQIKLHIARFLRQERITWLATITKSKTTTGTAKGK